MPYETPIFASPTNLAAVQSRMVNAMRGLSMLKTKHEVIDFNIREMQGKVVDELEMLSSLIKEGIMELLRGKFHRAELLTYLLSTPKKAETYCKLNEIRLANIVLPTFELTIEEKSIYNLAGLANGGHELQLARDKFREALRIMITMASLQFSINKLQESKNQNAMRINAVELIVVPKLKDIQMQMAEVLDSEERDNFFRLKLSKANQMKHKNESNKPDSLHEVRTHVPQFEEFEEIASETKPVRRKKSKVTKSERGQQTE